MDGYDKLLAPLCIGTWVNLMLFVVETQQFWRYLCRYSDDERWVQLSVLSVYLLNILNTVAECASVYLYTVTHWGDRIYLMGQYWPFQTWVCWLMRHGLRTPENSSAGRQLSNFTVKLGGMASTPGRQIEHFASGVKVTHTATVQVEEDPIPLNPMEMRKFRTFAGDVESNYEKSYRTTP
ncbi:hypothetical protein MNV49_004778 [Pseudohyphozyma bogoriensis]|nr:hypothetical protein MNV49_004778 [Pseudohyphozyma bogoriensis]